VRNLVRILIWTGIALLMQHGIFLYIENIYLDTDTEITVQKVDEEPVKEVEEENQNEIKIPYNVENISVSLDGQYISYIKNNILKVFDTIEKKEKNFKSDIIGETESYKWLNDENLILAIQKLEEDGVFYFEPVSYDIKKNEVRELVDFNYNKMRIPMESEEDKIENIAFSTATHSLYIKIRKANGLCDLYYSNVMNQIERVRYNKVIGNIVVPITNTNAVMEMGDSVTILNDPSYISIPNVDIPRLLSIDKDDNIYFGKEEDEKITSIYYTKLNGEEENWNTLFLKKSVDRNDIFIDYSGMIYINDKENESVSELTTGRLLSYKGDFIQAYNNGFISIDGNIITKNDINEIKLSIN